MRWQLTAVLGLLSAVAITGVALVSESALIEAEVLSRARASLSGETMSWASLEADGRDLVLKGAAPTPELRAVAAERIARVAGVRSVDASGAGLLPEMAPYAVTLERNGGVLTMTGAAPSAPDRARMVAAFTAAVPGAAYNDRLQLRRGMPDGGFLETLERLQPLLADLSEGRIELVDRRVEIRGRAASNAAYDRLARLDLRLPDGYSSGTPRIERPLVAPFVWSAEKTPDAIRLSGYAPDPAVRADLFGAVRAGEPKNPVVDAVDLAAGAPAGFAAAAAGAAEFLDLLDFGRVDLRDGVIAVSGRPSSPEAWRTLNAHLAAFRPSGFKVESSIELPVVAPYTLYASRKASRVTVTGFVPSPETAELLRAAARRVEGAAEVVVETSLAAGAPDRFAEAAVLSVTLLGDLVEGAVVIDEDRVAVTGVARNASALMDLQASVARAKPDGFTFDVRVDPPRVSPYVWSLSKSGGTIAILGSVPDEATRERIRQIVEQSAGDHAVADRTNLGSGLSPTIDLVRIATFAADRLKALETGVVSLNDDNFSVNGAAGDARNGQAVVNAFEGRLPAGVKRGIVQVDYPPAFQFAVERGLDVVRLTATVPDEAARAGLLEAARRTFGAADMTLDVTVGQDLPDGAAATAVLLTRAAGLLATGSITVDHSIVQIRGRAFTGSGAVRLSSAVAGALPRGYRLETSLGVADPGPKVAAGDCDLLLDEIGRRNAIYFESGSAQVAPDSHGVLDRIAMTLSLCPQARVVIEGHTDADGDPVANRELSLRRAEAVRKFLGDVGVDVARLEALGFGSDRPAVEETTEEDKAKNRRIEFNVIDGQAR